MSAVEKLTDREREILKLIGRYQLSSKEAALRAGIGYRRVNEICESAIRKLGVANRREALRLVMAEEGIELEHTPRTESGGEPVRVTGGRRGGSDREVFNGSLPDASSSRPPPPDFSDPAAAYAPRSPHDDGDLVGPRDSLARASVSRQRGPGAGFRDGAVEGGGVSAGGHNAQPYPRSDRAPGRPSVFSWVRGGTRYDELTPPQRIVAVLVLAGFFVMLVGWVLTSALQTSNAIQNMLPEYLHGVREPWIKLGH